MLQEHKGALSLDARDTTRLRILNCIRSKENISRIDVAKCLNFSPATVTSGSAALLKAGLISESEDGQRPESSRRGRPRVMLHLNGTALYVAGLKVKRHSVSVLITDFAGKELIEHSIRLLEVCMSPDTMVLFLRECLKETCGMIGKDITDISSMVIGLSGQVSAEENFVHWSPSLTGRGHAFGPLFNKYLPCPAFVENDANLVAKAEQVFGLGRTLRNYLVVTIEHGVGLGIVINGKLYRGERGCGAELGHTKVQLDGALCQCGQRGCLEAYVGAHAVLRDAAIADPQGGARTVEQILDEAKSGNVVFQQVLDRAGQVFAMSLANLINLFDPEKIILSGEQMNFDHLHSEAVRAQIAKYVVNVEKPTPEIVVNTWGDSMWAKGAAAYAIKQASILKIKALSD